MNPQNPTPSQFSTIEGIYEVCIGVRDPIAQIQYWELFGYRIGQMGELPKEIVKTLYGIDSSLRSIRLYHQDADHGLIRIMVWENPRNNGLEMSSMKTTGTRWATTLTADLLNIFNQSQEAEKSGFSIKYTNPSWEIIYNKERKSRPFVEPAIGVREMMLLQPLTRQVLFQRFNYSLLNYGQINQSSAFKTSQITHMGMVIQTDSKDSLRFYEEVLGLIRSRDDVETNDDSEAGRNMFELQPTERFIVTAFDDPRSSKTDFRLARSGRLYIIRFPEGIALENNFERSQPGCLGMSLYTYRVRGIENYFQRVQASAAQNVTDIVTNEFGEQSFSFVAPDGYFWTLVDKL